MSQIKSIKWILFNLKRSRSGLACLLLIVRSCCESPSSQVLSSLSIWKINVQARLAMPSLASCFLPIDFSSVYPHPSISRGVGVVVEEGGGGVSSELEHQSSFPRPPPDPGLFTIPAWLISAETLQQLQTSEDNPRCWKRGPRKEGRGGGGCSSGELGSLERDCQ